MSETQSTTEYVLVDGDGEPLPHHENYMSETIAHDLAAREEANSVYKSVSVETVDSNDNEEQYEQLAEQYQELANTLDGIIERLDFIAEHEQTDELQAERAEHMKMACRDIQRGDNWSHQAHNLRQASWAEGYLDDEQR